MADDKTDAKSKKEDKSVKTVVVAQLPTQPVNKAIDENGTEFNLVNIEDAMTEILETVRQLKKGLL